MSAADLLGIVLIIGIVGVTVVACVAWRNRMRESMPYVDWRQAAQDAAAQSSEWNEKSQAAARLAVNVEEACP